MSFLKLFSMLVLVSILVSCGIISEDPERGGTGTITGITITGSNTKAVLTKSAVAATSNISVYLYAKGKESVVIDSVMSDAEGVFKFTDVPVGEYVVMSDYMRFSGGVIWNITITANVLNSYNNVINMEQYVPKSIDTTGKSVVSIKYFHFDIVAINGVYEFTALNNFEQYLLVVESVNGVLVEESFFVSHLSTELTVTLDVINALGVSSDDIVSSSSSSSSQFLDTLIGDSLGGDVSSNTVMSFSSSDTNFIDTTVIDTIVIDTTVMDTSLIVISSSATLGNDILSSGVTDTVDVSSSSSEIIISSSALQDSISSGASLIAYWGFENNLVESENFVTGTSEGFIGYGEGVVGQALVLDSMEERVVTPELTQVLKLQSFTISVWFKLTRLGDNQELFNNHNSLPGVREGIDMFVGADNRIRFAMATNGGGVWSEIINPNATLINTWYNLVCTYDGIIQKMFVDGVLKSEQLVNSPILYSDVPPTIGASRAENVVTSRYFGGLIDELKIYDTPLDSVAISNEYGTIAANF